MRKMFWMSRNSNRSAIDQRCPVMSSRQGIGRQPERRRGPTVIRRMVDGMVAQLTDTKNIQALIDPSPGTATDRRRCGPSRMRRKPARADLRGASSKNTRFPTEYNRILLRSLQPLLKHHLVPRVQAMIVLGPSGNPKALKLFLDEIRNPQQTLWVKLWAIRGITNIKQNPSARLSAAQEIEAARVIAEQLDEKTKDMPWPLQLRALEALSKLRQGYIPAAPKNAEMAVAAMRILADPKARTEVRAEAARRRHDADHLGGARLQFPSGRVCRRPACRPCR